MLKANKIISIILSAIIALAMPISVAAATSSSPYVAGKTYTHQSKMNGKQIHNGIDVSHHNGDIDWDKVSKKADFAILRVGYRGYGASGKVIKDDKFDEYIKGARAKGIKVGIYFYSQALNKAEAIEEAKKTIEFLGNNELDLPIFYDYEFADVSSGRLDSAWRNGTINRTKMTENALAYMETIEATGHEAMIYANRSFLSDHVDHTVITKNGYRIWVAEYNTSTRFAGDYTVWQYSERGSIDGISGYIDCNFWYGDMTSEDIKSFDVQPVANQAYTGSAIKPNIKIFDGETQLVAGSDYYITYSSNKAVGMANATITGINEYEGYKQRTVEFKIVPAKVEGLKITKITTNSMDIAWGKNDNATNYRVQVYRSGAWKTYSTTSETKMTITGLASATNYSIRVCGYKTINGTEFASAYCSAEKDAVIPAKPTLTASATASSITLSWNKQSNATGYQVYRYDFTNKKYNLVKEIEPGTTNSYKISKLAENKKFQYRIRAYKINPLGKRVYGAYSDEKVIYTRPATPTLSTLTTPSKKRIKASWTKSNGSAGYQVQWSTTSDFSSNYKSVTVTGATKLSTTISTYQSKKKYYVRVRSYVNRDGAKYYSPWSNTKGITVK